MRIASLAVLASMAVAAYANALANPFVYDDLGTVAANESIRHLTNWRWILMGSGRWLTTYSYAIDYAIAGARPPWFHVTSLLLHLVNVLLCHRFIERERGARAAFVAAALFAVHPALSESVGYVSGRAGILCATGLLAALLSAQRAFTDGRRRWLGATLAFYLLALASKESAAPFPLLLLAYDRWFPRGAESAARRRLWWLHAPLILFTVLAGAVRVAALLHRDGGRLPTGAHYLTQAVVFWRYLAMMIVPVGQTLSHEIAQATPRDPGAWLAVAAIVALAVTLVRLRRRAPLVAFGGLWFVLLLVPAAAFPLHYAMAENRFYEASIGLWWTAGSAFAAMAAPRRLSDIAGAIVLAALVAATIARNRVWSSPVSLWREAAARAPSAWVPRYELGEAQREAGECAGAVATYREAIALAPDEPRPHENLGICLAELGRVDEGMVELEAAQKLLPRAPWICRNLGVLALRVKRPAEAAKWLRCALELAPRDEMSRRLLADAEAAAASAPSEPGNHTSK